MLGRRCPGQARVMQWPLRWILTKSLAARVPSNQPISFVVVMRADIVVGIRDPGSAVTYWARHMILT